MALPFFAIGKFVSTIININERLDKFDTRMGKLEIKIDDIEKDYVNRFEHVQENISDSKLEIIEKIGKMHIDVIDRINKKN